MSINPRRRQKVICIHEWAGVLSHNTVDGVATSSEVPKLHQNFFPGEVLPDLHLSELQSRYESKTNECFPPSVCCSHLYIKIEFEKTDELLAENLEVY